VPSRVGVVGAGTIGVGVAQAFAEADHQVVLVDVADGVLARARQRLVDELRTAQLLRRRSSRRPIDDVVAAVRCSADEQALAGCEFVVENVPERWSVKARLYPRLDAVCPPGCVLIANTSAIPITRLAALTGRPEAVIGVHFMNPVGLTTAVELIPGDRTSAHTVARTRALLATLGKEVIEVRDVPGFVANRVLMLTVNEAANLVHENVATAADVDRVFVGCFGHPMGPLATADLIGLDTVLDTLDVLYDSYRDDRYRPSPQLRLLVDAGRCGRKTGHGFYPYQRQQPGEVP
jgi:3-hydroxybutyryl-CoA dehydrogenase